MKIWAKDRIAWLDQQAPLAPRASKNSGRVAAGTKVTLTPNGSSGDIYYTLDGSDPRAPGGAKSKAARKYDGPITIKEGTRLMARLRRGQGWSGPLVADFTTR